jgi:hypothetical protein
MQFSTRSLVALVGLFGLALTACELANPGEFELTGEESSSFVFEHEGGWPLLERSAVPACADEIDNDNDGFADYSADAECTNVDDDSERLSGTQTSETPVVPMTLDTQSSLDPAEATLPKLEYCVGTANCLLFEVEGLAGAQVPYAVNYQLYVDFPFEIHITASAGFPGFPTGCKIGPIDATLHLDSYQIDGQTVLSAIDAEVPEVTDCGSTWNSLLNSALYLPGSTATLTVEGLLLNSSSGLPPEWE